MEITSFSKELYVVFLEICLAVFNSFHTHAPGIEEASLWLLANPNPKLLRVCNERNHVFEPSFISFCNGWLLITYFASYSPQSSWPSWRHHLSPVQRVFRLILGMPPEHHHNWHVCRARSAKGDIFASLWAPCRQLEKAQLLDRGHPECSWYQWF